MDDLGSLYAECARRIAEQVYLVAQDHRISVRAVHEAFARADAAWEQVRDDPSPEGWVRAEAMRVATGPRANLVRTFRRLRARHTRRRRGDDHGHEAGRLRDHGQGAVPDDDRLLAALGELSAVQVTALVLHHLAGLGLDRIALEMESSVDAAETRILGAEAAVAQSTGLAEGPDLARRLAELAGRAEFSLTPPHEAPHLSERRTRRAIGLTAGAAASVVLVLGLAVAVDRGGGPPFGSAAVSPAEVSDAPSAASDATPSVSPEPAEPTSTPTASALPERGSAPDLAPVPLAGRDFGYVRWAFRYADDIYVEFDRARLRDGQISNASTRLRVFRVAANASVEAGQQLSESFGGRSIGIEDFLTLVVSGGGAALPVTLRYDNGEIDSFEEVTTPESVAAASP